ncbi:MAG: oligosaccharide flippase family protein [Dolichospermum sp. LBC05a]|nr:oligosaccharide flippase family protein [Dolichospermum sp. OL01]MCO5795784.1 oligosaccharide flippase family protein [Dolichospermum sp. OL03]MCS6281871.1 oligosaccharide flippase family protein [Dolichospermum sp.]QSV57453.1 MAG: oligosaccharide flippase family protein [Dolichospermum sp. LBC05a]
MIHIVEKLRKRFPHDGFARHVLTLITGTAIAQIITVGSSPILTRIYTPDDFGLYALLFSISGVFSTVAAGRYELAIMLPEKDDDSINIVALCVVTASFTSLILLLFVVSFNATITQLLGTYQISHWLYLVPLQVILTSIYQSLNYWSNRKKQYKRLAISRILQSVAILLFSIVLGLTDQGFAGLMISSICAQVIATALLAFQILREEKQLVNLIAVANMKKQAVQYINFPKDLTISHFIGIVHQQIPIFLVSRLFGANSLGFFSIANRFISLPSTLIANAIGEVFRREATEHYRRDGRFNSILKATVRKNFLMALPIYSILFLFSPFIFSFILGKQWQQAGEYASIMAVMNFFSFVITPIDKGALIIGATRYIFFWHLSMLIANVSIGIFFHVQCTTITIFLWTIAFVRILHYIFDLYMESKYSYNEIISH